MFMDRETKQRELESLRQRVQELETELQPDSDTPWPPQSFYLAYHVLAGFVLGMFGAAVSLLFNVVGSLLVHQSPLRLIEYYLTFPLGQPWYDAIARGDNLSGIVLAIGCCLYLGTGMLIGIPFHLVLSKWCAGRSFAARMLVASVMGVLLWLVMFYGLLSWLQPLLFGGNWIVENIPWWVAALTHLVFAWTMVLVEPLGTFVARPNPSMERQ